MPKQSTDPQALRGLDDDELRALAQEIRDVLIDAVAVNGGHLGSNLGAVELTLALHRVFDSPRDAIVWDTGHQAYVHKLVTGRRDGFAGCARPAASPAIRRGPSPSTTSSRTATPPPRSSYAYGLAVARDCRRRRRRTSSRSSATAPSPAASRTRR